MGKRRFPELGDSRERGKERERGRGRRERERAFIDEEMMISITREYKLFSWGGGLRRTKKQRSPGFESWLSLLLSLWTVLRANLQMMLAVTYRANKSLFFLQNI